MKYYAGIGSRRTPKSIQKIMKKIASTLEKKNWILRSGGALGADIAFEKGIKKKENKEIFLPAKGVNGSDSEHYEVCRDSRLIASEHHSGWMSLSEYDRNLMGRNVYQILGKDLNTPVKFVICWTPDGCETSETRKRSTGGTGLAISLASSMGIEVFNLRNKDRLRRIVENLDLKLEEDEQKEYNKMMT